MGPSEPIRAVASSPPASPADNRPVRTLLIATPTTLGPLAAQLRLVPAEAGELVGAVLVGEDAGSAAPSAIALPAEPAVLGPVERLADIARRTRAERAVVCLPASMLARRLAVRTELRRLAIAERLVPPLAELLSREPAETGAGVMHAGAIDLAQLVGRRPREIDRDLVAGALKNRCVLITGAGGSIGSELVRVAASFAPRRIVLMERSENALFEIDRLLATRHPAVARTAILHDVVDAERTLAIVREHQPEVIFHAAAHKHVPLMEDHPAHATENNIFGTIAIADAAVACGAERFVLISTDKAVNPSSVMGATKRLAERYVQGLAAHDGAGRTRLCMVRFGNVLGSSGSVLSVWASQAAEGGPLTLTDARMTRYFMTIPEAAALVAQAAAMSGSTGPRSSGGEVFVLDMGEPVRIVDLAERFARACGFEPVLAGQPPADAQRPPIELRLTGVRPGEKLHEQLAYDAELLVPTAHPAVRCLAADTPPDLLDLAEMVADLAAVRHSADRGAVLAALRRHTPDIRPGGDLARAGDLAGSGQAPALASIDAA
jgi:FlaA1/EpsC-like NDP-sugar epimerase